MLLNPVLIYYRPIKNYEFVVFKGNFKKNLKAITKKEGIDLDIEYLSEISDIKTWIVRKKKEYDI